MLRTRKTHTEIDTDTETDTNTLRETCHSFSKHLLEASGTRRCLPLPCRKVGTLLNIYKKKKRKVGTSVWSQLQ